MVWENWHRRMNSETDVVHWPVDLQSHAVFKEQTRKALWEALVRA